MTQNSGGRKKKSIASGRPPLAKSRTATLSSKATRTIIRKHHTLLKEHGKALKAGETETAAQIQQQIQNNGGLKGYQQASQIGQLSARGGDTSQVLVSWLKEHGIVTCNSSDSTSTVKVLEVGCLSPENAIARCLNVQLERIDLKSTHALILKQDFMQRPLPSSDDERFHVVSLSLVVNFVADAKGRGEMLRRTTSFLKTNATTQKPLPVLFLTLPLPCMNNSRYMNIDLLTRMMASIGYTLCKQKSTAKIFYSLWRMERDAIRAETFKKAEIVCGATRNNFFIAI